MAGTTEKAFEFKCLNGDTCTELGEEKFNDKWNCCEKKGGKVQCPPNLPNMCAGKYACDGDYCCDYGDCSMYGGRRYCTDCISYILCNFQVSFCPSLHFLFPSC